MSWRGRDLFKLHLEQIEFVANQSLPLVLFSVGFAAFVTILESSYHMKIVVQTDAFVPGFATLLILRELAVIVTGLLLVARVGAAYTAELSLMKHRDQLAAMELMGLKPWKFLFWPRFTGSIVGGVMLSILSSFVCLLVAALVSEQVMGLNENMFIMTVQRFVRFSDFAISILKGLVFGSIIPIVSFQFALRSAGGAQGIGRATTGSVVAGSMTIIFLDLVLTWLASIA